jgi:hypothetical protein
MIDRKLIVLHVVFIDFFHLCLVRNVAVLYSFVDLL